MSSAGQLFSMPPKADAIRLRHMLEAAQSATGARTKAAMVAAAQTSWVPAINNHGGFARWGFAQGTDRWDAETTIRAAIGAQLTAQD